ncbi:MAG: glycosyltransferase family 39 protein [Planctomycetes bacterium]|nr:glycosyltransferase family 39 protein [Planctomycetota bacterium]
MHAFDRAVSGKCPVALVVLCGLALALRLWRLDVQPLWFDEALSAHIALAPDGLAFVHNTPPLYHWLSRGWVALFGGGAAGLRSLSAVAGAALVWAAFVAARALFDRRAAWATALLAAVAPLPLFYAQEARAYALLLVLLTAAVAAGWRVAAVGGRGPWVAWVGSGVLALHTHYLAALPLAVAGALLPWVAPAGERRRVLRATIVAGVAMAAALLPWWWWWSAHTPFQGSDMRWLALLWQQLSAPRAVLHSLELFALGGEAGRTPIVMKQFTTLPFPAWLRLAGLAAAGAVLGLGAVRLVRTERRSAAAFAVALGLLPLLGLCLLSTVRPVYAPGRYDLIALPGCLLLFGAAAAAATAPDRGWRRWIAWAAVAVFGLAVVVKDQRYLMAPPAPDAAPAVAAHLAAHVRDGDTVVLVGGVGLPVVVQLAQRDLPWAAGRCGAPPGRTFACRLLPLALEQAPAAMSRYLQAIEDRSLVHDLGTVAADVAASGATGVWLVLPDDLRDGGPAAATVGRALFQALFERGFQPVEGGDPALGIARCARPGR